MGDPKEAIKRNNYKPPRKRGRPRYEAKEQDGNIVYSYSAYGATNEDIAAVLGIDNKTLTKYYAKELQSGRATAKNTIAQRLYNIAVGKEPIKDEKTGKILVEGVRPNLSALIFLAKTRLGWKETQIVEQNVEMKSSGVQIYLPDNGMRFEEGKDA